MEKLLTIAIPTYNRASLLERQLTWLVEAVKGQESLCELIITDNCSADETQEVIGRWQTTFQEIGLQTRVNRHEKNLGAIRNIAYCLQEAKGKFVWTVSDDDWVSPGGVRFVLETAERHPDFSLLVLNFSSRHWRTRKLKYERCFEVEHDQVEEWGKQLFEAYLRDPNPSRWGGLALTTALVYRTTAAQDALNSWHEGLDNLTCQLYVTAYCALQGKTILTKETHMEMAGGRHFFTSDRTMLFRFRIAEVPEAFVKIAELGYSRKLCEEKIIDQRKELKWRLLWQNIIRGPFATLRVLKRYREAIEQIKHCRGKVAANPVEMAAEPKRVV